MKPKQTIPVVFLLFLSVSILGYEESESIIEPQEFPPNLSAFQVKSGQECSTARQKTGYCTPISDCFPFFIPENKTEHVRNRALVEMLIESAGFCDGNVQARSDITPIVLEQVLRSEILMCCPSFDSKSPDSFVLDEVDVEDDVYGEMYIGKSCGKLDTRIKELPTVDDVQTCTEQIITNCSRIVKGRKTKVGEYPWVVALMQKTRQFCGGSLINQNTVLTAAHCVQHMTASDVRNLRILIGDWDIRKTDDVKHQVRGAKAVKYHKGFSMDHLQHDIAIIILDKPVEYSETIQPACLHSGQPNFEDGKTKADVAGWGALTEGGSQPSDLRAVTVRVLTQESCVKKYSGTNNKIRAGMFCAGADKGEDSCQGDSGGPLTTDSKTQAKQIGIVSWGIGCGRYPGVYTRISSYLKWINVNMIKDMGYE